MKRLRRGSGLSQEALAERAGVSSKAIGALESGLRTSPYPKTIALLAGALGLDEAGRRELERAARRRRMQRDEPGALPHPLAPLIGRAGDTQAIVHRLERDRLVTIVGPGGIGKTSLAIAAAGAIGARYPDGAAFCDFSTLTDAEHIAGTIAAACSVAFGAAEPAMESVAKALKSSQRLLVFDNCEHVCEPIARAASTLLQTCPHLAILATSRRRLGVLAETLYPLQPLAFPSERAASEIAAAAARGFGGIELFVERAARADPSFVFSDVNAPLVASICRHVDGSPLAIELAAAQLRFIGVLELHARLREHGGLHLDSRVGVERHQSLRNALAWSYELLSERERDFFRALAVFADGFTFEAARAVCCPENTDEFAVLELIAGLVDASLLTVDRSSDETRYRFLETTRVYARERSIACGEHGPLAARHLAFYRQSADVDVICTDLAEVRAALTWSLGGGDALAGADLIANLGAQWAAMGGLAREGFDWIDRFVAAVASRETLLLARLWTAKARLACNVVRYKDGFDFSLRALELSRAAGDPLARSDALRIYAVTCAALEDFDGAERALAQAESTLEAAPRSKCRFALVSTRAHVAWWRGDYAAAATYFDEARQVARGAEKRAHLVSVSVNLAEVEHARGRTDVALEVARALWADKTMRGYHDESLLANLAGYAIARDDVATTRRSARDLWATERRRPASSAFTAALEHVALAAALEREFDTAARLAGYCEKWYRKAGQERQFTELQTHERLSQLLRTHVAPERLAALHVAGAAMHMSAAIRLAEGDSGSVAFGDAATASPTG